MIKKKRRMIKISGVVVSLAELKKILLETQWKYLLMKWNNVWAELWNNMIGEMGGNLDHIKLWTDSYKVWVLRTRRFLIFLVYFHRCLTFSIMKRKKDLCVFGQLCRKSSKQLPINKIHPVHSILHNITKLTPQI